MIRSFSRCLMAAVLVSSLVSCAPKKTPVTNVQPPTVAQQNATAPQPDLANAGAIFCADVSVLQMSLNQAGATLKVDGKMGAATKKAVSAFQQKHGLKVTGKADPDTCRKLGLS